jgi:hypothetical protein
MKKFKESVTQVSEIQLRSYKESEPVVTDDLTFEGFSTALHDISTKQTTEIEAPQQKGLDTQEPGSQSESAVHSHEDLITQEPSSQSLDADILQSAVQLVDATKTMERSPQAPSDPHLDNHEAASEVPTPQAPSTQSVDAGQASLPMITPLQTVPLENST